MTPRQCVARAAWHDHVNAVHAPRALRHWLTDTTSLTGKLIAHSRQFRLQRLHQRRSSSLADEFGMLALARPIRVWEREVLLHCDGVPVVFAHTVAPLRMTAGDWPWWDGLGERSLGSMLFSDPLVKRGALQFARLQQPHPLMRRLRAVLGEYGKESRLFARRSLFQRRQSVLLVSEIFLPAIATLARPGDVPVRAGQNSQDAPRMQPPALFIGEYALKT